MSRPSALVATLFLASGASPALAAESPIPTWTHLSSRTGGLPQPNGGIQQTTGFTFDIDGISDLVTSERTQAPGLFWLRRPPARTLRDVARQCGNRRTCPQATIEVPDEGLPAMIESGVRNIWQAREIKDGRHFAGLTGEARAVELPVERDTEMTLPR